MPTILHFADAHIDMTNYGKHDPQTGLPLRVMDFLKSLDTIIDAAVNENVDMVIFAGDAYKDRNPAPTFQREWGRRIMRLSRAGIPTLLLVGNHDLSPALGRAHALESFDTLEVPLIHVLDKPTFLKPEDLNDLPLQVIALPWISRSGYMAHSGTLQADTSQVFTGLEQRLTELVAGWLEDANPTIPMVLTAHASVAGASYGGERTVMLGSDLVLPGSLVRDARLDYVALGHIHKPQDLNPDSHPPVIYPGSIERVDFGEWSDDKFFVVAHIERGKTQVEWRKLEGIRPFVDRKLKLESQENISEVLLAALPDPKELEGAIVRLTIEYPRDWEALIDDSLFREHASFAFEFHLAKRPKMETRLRLPEDQNIGSLTALELLEKYLRSSQPDTDDMTRLLKLAGEVIEEASKQE